MGNGLRVLGVLVPVVLLSAACQSTAPTSSPAPSASAAAVSTAPIVTPAPTAAPASATVSPSTPPPTSPPSPTPSPTPAPMLVVVVPGDTISGIAHRYGTTVEALLAANPQITAPSLIGVGEVIAVPYELQNQRPRGSHNASGQSADSNANGSPWNAEQQGRESCVATGWTQDPNDPTVALRVRIIVDERLVAAVVADQYVSGLANVVGGTDYAGYTVDLYPLMTHGVVHSVRTQAQDLQTGEWVNLGATPRSLDCLE